ncbi:hypothetical protein EIP91_006017 [Steccherinum ochraceum]|uniref:Uncharacterized protein n=1 Tax=Steccherinum ochraceum TaxID=92696 RepID=A0A4R0R6C4_9APHY|nr:hypothetical protein EIP91_006017 [Steccherinum ochraceum]
MSATTSQILELARYMLRWRPRDAQVRGSGTSGTFRLLSPNHVNATQQKITSVKSTAGPLASLAHRSGRLATGLQTGPLPTSSISNILVSTSPLCQTVSTGEVILKMPSMTTLVKIVLSFGRVGYSGQAAREGSG